MGISSERLGSFAAGITLCVSLLGCQKLAEKDPIEAKKEAIIASMNIILERENLVINPESTCTILIVGSKPTKTSTMYLTCSDSNNEEQEYKEIMKNPATETYFTVISGLSGNNTHIQGDTACFQMIAEHPTNPKGPGIKMESKNCIGETI